MNHSKHPLCINPNRIELNEAYMQMAQVWAKRSKANRKQVGALIVKNEQIISDGYNGMPAGETDDVCEYYDWPADYVEGVSPFEAQKVLYTKAHVLHAEANAITKLSKNGGVGSKDAIMYVTLSPCFECAKLIKQAGIKAVYYREKYRDTRGIDFLIERGVDVVHLENKDEN